MNATTRRVKIRPATFDDCEDIVRLEHTIFPHYGEKFDRRFFSTIKPIIGELLTVVTFQGQIQGYLSIARLRRAAVDFILIEDIASIKELADSHLRRDNKPLAGMFLEVLAVAPWADFRVRYLLINHAFRIFRNSLSLDWYAHPITAKGRRFASRHGFLPIPDSRAGLFRRSKSVGGAEPNARKALSRD